MFNELEIVYWFLLNKDLGIKDVSAQDFLSCLLSSALYAKSLTLDEEIKVFEAFIGHNYP